MKRIGSSDSSSGLITICPSSEEQSPRNNQLYGRDFQSMLEGLDEEGCVEEFGGHHSEKKRRLRVDQVKALEKNFEVENKLEPERKVKLAQELGLQPRQVAVWFQNRRARWKTKQLERDYGVLKANYDALKVKYDTLNKDNEALHKEVKELKSRLEKEKSTSDVSVKKETTTLVAESEEEEKRNPNPTLETSIPSPMSKDDIHVGTTGSPFPIELKDGSSDSDSSAILNEESSPKAAISSSSGVVLQSQDLWTLSPESSPVKFNCFTPSSSSMNYFQYQKPNHVKMEEHNFLSADEACNYFSDEQAPTLQWYCPDQWS